MQELLLLEEDVKALEEMYPQGEKVMNTKFLHTWSCLFWTINYGCLNILCYILGWDDMGYDCSWIFGQTCVGNFGVRGLGIIMQSPIMLSSIDRYSWQKLGYWETADMLIC